MILGNLLKVSEFISLCKKKKRKNTNLYLLFLCYRITVKVKLQIISTLVILVIKYLKRTLFFNIERKGSLGLVEFNLVIKIITIRRQVGPNNAWSDV